MKKINYLILLITFILSPYLVKADCTTEEMNHFKEIKSSFGIAYRIEDDTKLYTIRLYNPEPENYDFMIYTDEYLDCEDENENETYCYDVKPGNYKIGIMGITETCKDVINKTTLKLSKYNEYYGDPLCEGIEEFYLCQKTYDKEIDRETFESRVATYRKTLESKEEKETIKEKEENKIVKYVKDNLVQIIVIAVFVIMLIITAILTASSIKKSRRLEWQKISKKYLFVYY